MSHIGSRPILADEFNILIGVNLRLFGKVVKLRPRRPDAVSNYPPNTSISFTELRLPQPTEHWLSKTAHDGRPLRGAV